MANQWQQTWDFEFSEEALAAEIAQAEAEAASAEDSPRAESVQYNRERNLVEVHLQNGAIFAFPPHLAQGLDTATPEQLDDVWLGGHGQSWCHRSSHDTGFGRSTKATKILVHFCDRIPSIDVPTRPETNASGQRDH